MRTDRPAEAGHYGSPLLMAACGDGRGREIGELACEQRDDRARAERRGVLASRLERLPHLVAVARLQAARKAGERGAVHACGAGNRAWARSHLVRDQAGRFVAATPLRRACRTSVSRRSVSARSTARPIAVSR